MLDDILMRYKTGYQTCQRLIDSYRRNAPEHSFEASVAAGREEAMRDDEFWVGVGFLAGILQNCAIRPRLMYDFLIRNKN